MKEELAKIIHEKVAQVKEQTYKEIEALKSENARLLEITHTAIAENTKLTEQLKNAVVLPKHFIKEACYDGLHKRYEVYHSRIETFCAVCDDTFDTLEAAEARLKELQGDK